MEAKELPLDHPDRVLTKADEAMLYSILCDEVAWLRATLGRIMNKLDKNDPEKLIIQAEMDKINYDLDNTNKDVERKKALSRYVLKRLRELGQITHAE